MIDYFGLRMDIEDFLDLEIGERVDPEDRLKFVAAATDYVMWLIKVYDSKSKLKKSKNTREAKENGN